MKKNMKINSGALIVTYQITKLNMHLTCILPHLSYLKKIYLWY